MVNTRDFESRNPSSILGMAEVASRSGRAFLTILNCLLSIVSIYLFRCLMEWLSVLLQPMTALHAHNWCTCPRPAANPARDMSVHICLDCAQIWLAEAGSVGGCPRGSSQRFSKIEEARRTPSQCSHECLFMCCGCDRVSGLHCMHVPFRIPVSKYGKRRHSTAFSSHTATCILI